MRPLFQVAAIVLVAACAAGAFVETLRAATPPNSVVIDNFSFGPASLTVARGTKVVWTNKDDEPHTVVSADNPKLMKSPALDSDDSFAFTFDQAGTYRYFCSIHPRMQGTVIVQ
jgi:plastocyanin